MTNLYDANLSEIELSKVLSARFPLSSMDGFQWTYGQEGYKDFSFGSRIAMTNGLAGVVHDLAHAVDFGAASFSYRALGGKFRFQQGQYLATGQMTEREARTMGIEARLIEILGIQVNWDSYLNVAIKLTSHLADWPAYNKNKDVIKQIVLDSYCSHTEDRVLSELRRWFLCTRRVRKQFEVEREVPYLLRLDRMLRAA